MYITLSFTIDMSFKNSVVFVLYISIICIQIPLTKKERKMSVATVTDNKLITHYDDCSVSQ